MAALVRDVRCPDVVRLRSTAVREDDRMSIPSKTNLELRADERRSHRRMQWVLLIAVLIGAFASTAVAVIHGDAGIGVGGFGWLVPLTALARKLFS
jgi:hypothetical protein